MDLEKVARSKSGSLVPSVLVGGDGPILHINQTTLALVTAQNVAAKENNMVGVKGMPIMHGLVRAMPVGLMINLMGKV